MKNGYITFKNAKEKTREWMKELLPQRNRHKDFVYKPEDSILLVIDMQNYFLADDAHAFIPVGKFILSQIKRLVARYYENHLPVIFTRYAVLKEDPYDIMNKWWGGVLTVDDPESFLTEELDTEKGEVILKPGYSAFFKTDLEKILTDKGIKQVVTTGVMTHLCCETTAREAFQRGYEVYFVIDGTGTYDEKIHTASLFNLSHGFAVPVTTEEVLRKFNK
ncbi:MAG: isochorismatase family protein [Candidatus Cloacimonadota bacterium]|nr:MAG: isochorismatase family protein [Candidatus Cloacimonadota bacterium]